MGARIELVVCFSLGIADGNEISFIIQTLAAYEVYADSATMFGQLQDHTSYR